MARGCRKFVELLTPHSGRRRVTDVIRLTRVCWVLCLTPFAVVAEQADALQALVDIEQAAEAFLAARTTGGTASAVALDQRLRLANCEQPLQAFLRDGAKIRQRTIVGVRCLGPQPWKVYVPVNIVVTETVLVLTSNLPRGHTLSASDLKREKRDVSRLPGGYLASIEEAVGHRLKQSLRAGNIVTPATVQAELLIRRGQTVTLNAATDAINIRMTGKALMDGALNQRIRVENTSSGRVVEGLVRSAERVEVLVQ
ncbi:MAG: flagellar basal body P-ring formation chaperone FlgA [Woeseia sp.]